MFADSLARRRPARCRVDPAAPGDVGDDILVTCDRTGDGHYEVLAGIRSPYLRLPGYRHPVARCGAQFDWRRAACVTDTGTVRIGGRGVFRSNETRRRLSAARDCTLRWRWRLHIPQAGMLEGRFDVTVLRAAGGEEEGWIFELGSLGPLSLRAR